MVTIDILESLPSFCPEIVVTLRSIQSNASQLLVKEVKMATMRKMVLFEVKMHQTMMIKRCVMDLVLFRTHEEEFVAALSPGCLRSL